MIKNILVLSQPVLAILAMITILVQAKGVGLGQTWGGSGGFYSSRRGVEKILFRATIVVVALFFVISVIVHLI
jgi:protein translocase SecG subunit